uniref:Uncharacterized protein n=1 Tax=Trichogramma kaykai TaxID=54128 RepID=A0ABD2X3C0_9HYME
MHALVTVHWTRCATGRARGDSYKRGDAYFADRVCNPYVRLAKAASGHIYIGKARTILHSQLSRPTRVQADDDTISHNKRIACTCQCSSQKMNRTRALLGRNV